MSGHSAARPAPEFVAAPACVDQSIDIALFCILFCGAARIPRAATIPMPMQPALPDDSAAAADPAATAGTAAAVPSSFEAALAELEAIVARMESSELPLEEALAGYRRGAQLLQFCQSALKDAQQQVQILEAGLLQDFADADRGD